MPSEGTDPRWLKATSVHSATHAVLAWALVSCMTSTTQNTYHMYHITCSRWEVLRQMVRLGMISLGPTMEMPHLMCTAWAAHGRRSGLWEVLNQSSLTIVCGSNLTKRTH